MTPARAAMLCLAAILAPGASGCGGSAAPAESAQGKSASPTVIIRVGSGADVQIDVEVARTDPERQRGLMYRRSLEPGKGMLFLFPSSETHKFWMRNTYIPLDMIFLSEDRKVVFVEESADPLTETPRGPEAHTQFVVEVPGGWARTHGIEPGTTARFVGVPGFASPQGATP